ncbi:hypothetical protein DENSPDRAFT_535505 [Dentipellis sp. KUC8613]|nr:hypothetical protein DENSPDRAFT_535505 [Dentipellis sp. KUC8613]
MPTLPTSDGLPHVSGDQRLAQRRTGRGTAERPKVYQRARSAKDRQRDLQKHLDEQMELKRRKDDEVYASCLRNFDKVWEGLEEFDRRHQHLSDGIRELKQLDIEIEQEHRAYNIISGEVRQGLEKLKETSAETKRCVEEETQHLHAWGRQLKATALAIEAESKQIDKFRQQNKQTEQAINECKQSVSECQQVAKEFIRHDNARREHQRHLRREARRISEGRHNRQIGE